MSKAMSQFLFRTVLVKLTSQVTRKNPNVSSLSTRPFSVSLKYDKTNSFVASYLTSSLGFSHEIALSTSKFVNFDSPDQPDKAVQFLRSFGFSQTQISKLVRSYPGVLVSDPDNIVFPKFKFLRIKGLSETEIVKMLSWSPGILTTSLSNRIIPAYDKLRIFLQCEKRTLETVKRYPDILCHGFREIEANAEILRQHGVSETKIASFLEYHPRSFVSHPDRFREIVSGVAKMGFEASTANFTVAVRVSLELGKSKWERKVELFRKCGFSEEDFVEIFRREPRAISYSEQKISSAMEIFVEKMNWSPSLVSTYPKVFGLSLKKRIIPRCSVFKALISKGLVNDNVSLASLLSTSEEIFLQKFVMRHNVFAPKLLALYQKKLNL